MNETSEPLEIGLGSFVGIRKAKTFITGTVDGIKLRDGVLERISIEEIDPWFYMDAGWLFMDMEEEVREDEV